MSTITQLRAACPSLTIQADGWGYELGDRGAEASMKLYVEGPHLQAAINVIGGNPPTTFTLGGTSVLRRIPLLFPRDPSLVCYSARAYAPDGVVPLPGLVDDAPIPADNHDWGIDYEFYFIDLRFRTPSYPLDGDYPTVTRSRDATVEMRTRPGTSYKFPTDGLVLLQDVGVPVQVAQYAFTFSGLTSLQDDLYDNLIGCVNSTIFMGKPIGTMLYLGCSSQGVQRVGGVPSFTATQRFAYSKIPHRNVMRPDGNGFEAPVWTSNTGKYLLEADNLNQLYS